MSQASQSVDKPSHHYLDLTTHLKSECTVSGALSFICHLSRLAAAAPIKIRKVPGGWRISLSYFYYFYSIIYKIISSSFLSHAAFGSREDSIDGYEASSNTWFMPILTRTLWCIEFSSGLIIAITGYKRMRYMINCLIHLQQINKEFDLLYLPSFHNEFKTWLKIAVLLICGYIGSFMDYIIYMYDVIIANERVPFFSIVIIFTYLNILQYQLVTIQINLVIMRLVYTQQRLNSCLKILLAQLKQDTSERNDLKKKKNDKEIRINIPDSKSFIKLYTSSAFRGSKLSLTLIRQLINVYCSICHMIRLSNDGNGVGLIMLLLYCIGFLISGPYFVVTAMFRSQSEIPLPKTISIIAWVIVCYLMIITVTEACHTAHVQLKRTKYLVKQLVRYTPTENTAIHHELKLFRWHISLNPVNFYSMYLLKFDRNLAIAAVSLVVTYLSVVINL